MVIECAFGRCKKRFLCLGRELDINQKDLLNVVLTCFTLHNFITEIDGDEAVCSQLGLSSDEQFAEFHRNSQPQTAPVRGASGTDAAHNRDVIADYLWQGSL